MKQANQELKLDQHLLKDSAIIEKMLECADINSADVVLEAGPGQGSITSQIAKKAKKVIAIELDKNFKSYLDTLPKNVEVKYGNVLEEMHKIKFNKIIANLPFSITEPFFAKLLKQDFDSAVLIVGKSFLNLFSNKGKWAVIAKIFFDIIKTFDLPRTAFEPRPRVDCVLVCLEKNTAQLSDKEQIMKEFVLQDNKKTKNALMTAFKRVKNLPKKEAKDLADSIGIPKEILDKNARMLSNEQFLNLCEKIN